MDKGHKTEDMILAGWMARDMGGKRNAQMLLAYAAAFFGLAIWRFRFD